MLRTYRYNDGTIKILAESVSGRICELYDEDFVRRVRCAAVMELKPLMFTGAHSQAAIVTREAGKDTEKVELLTSTPSEIVTAYKEAGLEAFAPLIVRKGAFMPTHFAQVGRALTLFD